MKKLLLFTTLLFFSNFLLQAQEVPEVQKTLLTKIAASWCGPCGTWGWSMWSDVIEDNNEKAVLMAVHHAGNLVSSTSSALADNLDILGQPRFYVNNEDQNVNASGAATKRTQIQETVDNNFIMSPIAGVGLDVSLNGTELYINTKTKFFQAVDGEYRVGIYIVEDAVISFQASIGDNASHKRLLRTAVGEHFGQEVVNGAANTNDEFDHQFTIAVDPQWDLNNVEFVAVVWKRDNQDFLFVNTNSTQEILNTTSTSDLAFSNLSMDITPNISDREMTIQLDLTQSQEELNIQLIDQLGRNVSNIFSGNLNAGNHQFQINRTDVKQAGLYFVLVKNENKLMSQKVIFK